MRDTVAGSRGSLEGEHGLVQLRQGGARFGHELGEQVLHASLLASQGAIVLAIHQGSMNGAVAAFTQARVCCIGAA